MSVELDRPGQIEALEAYSRGEIGRRDVGDRPGEPIAFGYLLMKLHEYRLPLSRIPSDRNSPGFQLIKHLASRAPHGR